LTYQLEQIPESDKSAKASKLKDLNEARAFTYDLNWPTANGTALRKFNYDDLNNTFTGIMSQKASLVAKRGDQDKTAKDAQTTLDALHIGAVDFIAKPPPGASVLEIAALGDELSEKVRTFGTRRSQRSFKSPPAANPGPHGRSECIAIGTSTGGPVALSRIVPRLPKNFPSPIVIAQHMPPGFTAPLAERLNASSELEVSEGTNGMTLRAGTAVVAPAGHRARVRRIGKQFTLELEEAERGTLTPSVDALFASIGALCKQGALAVLLTGMGRDGVEGLRVVRASGGYAVGQDEASCVVYGMPRAAAEAGLIDRVCTLDELPPVLCSLAGLEVPLQRGEGSRPPPPGT